MDWKKNNSAGEDQLHFTQIPSVSNSGSHNYIHQSIHESFNP
jgi:hypothetical protein